MGQIVGGKRLKLPVTVQFSWKSPVHDSREGLKDFFKLIFDINISSNII